jgi:hypothetical protein
LIRAVVSVAQCGIQLKVKDNRVIGFEPWEDWPGARSANNLTQRALDPLSKIPEFKKSVVKIGPA